MKKLQIMIEVEIDEKEIANVEVTDGNHITTEEFIKGLEIKESSDRDSGAVKLFNEDEEYYLMNIGANSFLNGSVQTFSMFNRIHSNIPMKFWTDPNIERPLVRLFRLYILFFTVCQVFIYHVLKILF